MKILRSPNLARGDDGITVQLTKRRQFARGGLVQAAGKVRGAGRFGDTMLVHINPQEFAQLKRAWGEPHYNPDTQLPEFFDWWDAAKTIAPYVVGALGKKASTDQANQNPAPPADPNMTTHLGTPGTNARTANYTDHEDPSSFYTYGQKSGERPFFKNNSLSAVSYKPGAQLQPKLQSSPSTGQAILGGIGGGVLQTIMKDPKGAYDAVKGWFGGNPSSIPGASGGAGGGAGGAGGVGMSTGDLTALTGEGNAAASGAGAGLLPGSTAGSAMVDTGVPVSTIGTLPAEQGATAAASSATGAPATGGLGTAAAGVGSFLALAALGKHLQDNTAGLGYRDSRALAAGLAQNAQTADPTHGRGQYANTPLGAAPPGFKTWNQYFYATQMMQQAQHASGGAKDQGTYRMLMQEAGLPSDPSFYMKTYPGQDVAWNAIMGPNGIGTPSASHGGRARGGLIQRFDVGGPVYTQNAAMSGAGNAFQPQLGSMAFDQGHPTPPQQAGPMGNIGNIFAQKPPGMSQYDWNTQGAAGRPSDGGFGNTLRASLPPYMANYGAGQAGPTAPGGGLAQAQQAFQQQHLGAMRPTGMFPPNLSQGPPGLPPAQPPITGITGVGPPRPQIPPMTGSPGQGPVPPPSAMPPPSPPSRPPMPMQPRMLWSGNDRAMPGQRRFDTGGPVSGPGTGISDQIPARLSDGEYVIPAHIVAALGDGSTKAGAARLDELQRQVRRMTGRQMAKNRHPKAAPPPIALIGDQK